MTNPAFATGSGYPPNPSEKFGFAWMAIAIIITCLLLAWLFSGCHAPQTITRTEYLDVPVVVHDTITAYMEPDSNFFAHDTVIDIRYITKLQKFWYSIHDTLKVPYTDTVQVVKNIEKTFTEKVELWLFPVLCGALFVCIVIVGFPIVLKFIKPI